MRTRLAIGISLAVVVVTGLVHADDESDRRSILSQIDSKLDYAANELYGLERKSDASDTDDAQSYIREVERLVDELKRVKGEDSAAARVVGYYPDYIKDFKYANDELRKLKNRQTKAADYLRLCKEFDSSMIAKATAAKDDPDGGSDLREFAQATGRKAEDMMNDASRQWSEVERSRDDAKRFSASEGKWANVRSNLHASATAIAQIWRDDWDNAKRACEEVVRKDRHREVERALTKLSDSRAGRAELRSKLDEQLEKLADLIKDVHTQSGTSSINSALESTKELENLLDRLSRSAGDDRTASQIASTWPAWVKQVRDAIEALKEMKLNQNRVDTAAAMCEATEKQLDELSKKVVDDRADYEDPEKTLNEEADRLGTPIKNAMQGALDVDRKLSDLVGKAKNFSQSDGKWSRVGSNLRDSADRVFAYWRDQYNAMTKVCTNVAMGRDHPKVKSTISEWKRSLASPGEQLENDVKSWVARARATYRLDCQAMQDMWEAYCGTDFEPNDNEAGERPKQTAAMLQDKMQAQMKPLLAELPPLIDRVTKLRSKKETRSRATELMASLDKEKGRLARLSVQDTWRGNNDPIRFYAAKYGNDQHASMWSSYGCTVPTSPTGYAVFPGSGATKPDCINPDKCEIYEFKPDSPSGAKEGNAQVSDYRSSVPAYYTERYRAKQPAADALGGAAIMKTLSEKCLRGDKIELDAQVRTYKMCDKRYECIQE